MSNPQQPLYGLKPTKKYLVAIDSDGCAFDAMGIKQRECFCPMMIAYFGLQPVAQAARECKEFADLYSNTRGSNRHKTMVRILTELLPSHPMVKERNFTVPQFPYYVQWVSNSDSVLSDAGLIKAIEMSSNADERKEFGVVLKWSRRVNDLVAEIVRHVPPFSFVRESLEKAFPSADMIVCSATPTEALEREWAEHDLRKYVKVVAGQEMGSKYHHLGLVSTGKYDKDKVIMLGDAMGDMAAAKDNGVLFYPIVPGREDASWERFQAEALDHFLAGRYAGDYEAERIAEFESSLPLHPSWLL